MGDRALKLHSFNATVGADRLVRLELEIDKGLRSFVHVGTALQIIKTEGLYSEAGFETFERYCKVRWGIGSSQRARLMTAAQVVEGLLGSPIGELPTPERESQVRPLAALPEPDRAGAWSDAVEAAGGGQPTAKQVEAAVAKRQPPKKDHPAPFSDPILAAIDRQLPAAGVVLDPFAGTGRIHELATEQRRTMGVELQPKWAAMHPDTVVGNARALDLEDGSVDAIATSPTYGNRMADHHVATDDSVRLTYTHTHGEPLEADNSGLLHWGPEYRAFHEDAWAEAVRVLRPGGTFTINVKNHLVLGEVQRVVEWHVSTLMLEHGLELVALDVIPTAGLPAGANAAARTGFEFVLTFKKGDHE